LLKVVLTLSPLGAVYMRYKTGSGVFWGGERPGPTPKRRTAPNGGHSPKGAQVLMWIRMRGPGPPLRTKLLPPRRAADAEDLN